MKRCEIAWLLVSVGQGLVAVPRGMSSSSRRRRVSLGGVVAGAEEMHQLLLGSDLAVALETWRPNGEIVALQFGTSLFASVFGFGDAILAMPLLTLLFGLDATTAAPLVTTVSTVMICANLAIDIRSGKMEAVGRWTESAALVAGAAAGVPVGVHALVSLDPELLRAAVGVVLIAYAAKQFAKDEPPRTALNILAVIPFGFAAGVLGGAVAEPGPPCVVLSRLAKWDPVTMRVMLQRFFLPVQLLALFDLNQEGLLTEPVLLQAVAAVPAVALAGFLGTKLNRSIDPAVFNTLIAALVLALGLLCCSTAAPYLLASIDARLPAA
mmetsp:Transcript_11721/g.37319  ORF Transcript_11721/g.37319 Transcript_11721/m.37319 type:complete len:324 (-) Transcript_11721:148-1119(-)